MLVCMCVYYMSVWIIRETQADFMVKQKPEGGGGGGTGSISPIVWRRGKFKLQGLTNERERKICRGINKRNENKVFFSFKYKKK